MNYVYIARRGDREKIISKLNGFEKLSQEKLIEVYNFEVQKGITGVHAQALHLIALHSTFLKKFEKSPIIIENNSVIGMGDTIDASFFN